MPSLPGKTCRVQGCAKVATIKNKGFCEDHKHKSWEQHQKRLDGQKRIYQLPIWRKLRAFVINRAGGLCENCFKNGMIVVGTDVDHIRPISQGGAEDDESNLQLLCKACHAAKTARE